MVGVPQTDGLLVRMFMLGKSFQNPGLSSSNPATATHKSGRPSGLWAFGSAPCARRALTAWRPWQSRLPRVGWSVHVVASASISPVSCGTVAVPGTVITPFLRTPRRDQLLAQTVVFPRATHAEPCHVPADRTDQAVSFGSPGGPEKDARDMESGEIDGRGLLVAASNTAPLLQAVDAPLDGVALLVRPVVGGRWSAAGRSASSAVGLLVGPFRDLRPDAASAGADGRGSRGRSRPGRPGPCPVWCADDRTVGERAGRPSPQ
ncbi:hypothetical protein SXANM310S_02697 [Streptomyces xanthochromogenes]